MVDTDTVAVVARLILVQQSQGSGYKGQEKGGSRVVEGR